MNEKCKRCNDCARIANSEDGEPWSAWESLPPGADLAIRMGLVKPIPCPACGGEGANPDLSDESYLGSEAEWLDSFYDEEIM